MKRGEVQQMLAATNRWWRDPIGWATKDPDLREASHAPFDYRAGVLRDFTRGGLYVLRGPRRVGKTVELKRTIEELLASGVNPRCITHMAVDGLRARDLGMLVDAADSLMPDEDGRFWLIDEITGITDGWPGRIKWLRDNDARFRSDTVVLTGSSASNLTEATKALAGRRGAAEATDRVLLPMGFRSFVSLACPEPPPAAPGPWCLTEATVEAMTEACRILAPWLGALIRAWDDYLRIGGFPAAVAAHAARREDPLALRAGLMDVIHGDAFRSADWSRAQTRRLLTLLEDGLCSPCNISSLVNQTGVAHGTIKLRLSELREAFVIWPCYREDRLRPKTGAQAKLYFSDPIYTQLAGSGATEFSRLSEQQLGLALLRAAERAAPGAHLDFEQVLHHRSRTGREIDFVGPGFGGLAIESKHVDGGWRRAAQTLKASPWRGVVATRSELDLSNEVAAVPAALLAWLLDS